MTDRLDEIYNRINSVPMASSGDMPWVDDIKYLLHIYENLAIDHYNLQERYEQLYNAYHSYRIKSKTRS